MDLSWRFFFFSLTITFLLTLTVAQQKPLNHVCVNNSGNFTRHSVYEKNLKILLFNFSLNRSNDNYGFYNLSIGQGSERANVIALCRGDDVAASYACLDCIIGAAAELRARCPNQKEAIIWYDYCMIRYSNRSIFGVMETRPGFWTASSSNNVTDNNVDAFNRALFGLLNTIITTKQNSLVVKCAVGTAQVSYDQTIYALVQCTPDLSVNDCITCLDLDIQLIPQFLDRKQGGRIYGPSCNIRFEDYSFFNLIASPILPLPPPPAAAAPPLSPPPSPPPSTGIYPIFALFLSVQHLFSYSNENGFN